MNHEPDPRGTGPAPDDAVDGIVEQPGAYAYLVLFMLALVTAVSLVDRQILSVLAQPIKHELGLSDTQIGLLSGLTFAVFYASCGIPLGWLADRVRRVSLIAVACGFWSLMTAGMALAQGFWQLALARVGVGIGEAGSNPAAFSIISDYFPRRFRGRGIAIITAGGPVGAAIGVAAAALLADQLGWRWTFAILGMVGIVVGIMAYAVIREPLRGRFDAPSQSVGSISLWAGLREFFQTPALALAALAAGFMAMSTYGTMGWLPSFLMREKGMSLAEVGKYYSVFAGASHGLGLILSGLIVDRLGVRDFRFYGWTPALAAILAIPLFLFSLQLESWRATLILMFVPAMMFVFYAAPTLTLVNNAVPARSRGLSSSIAQLIVNLVGLGCGPTLIGIFSDRFGAGHLGAAMATVVLPALGIAAVLFCLAARATRHIARAAS